MCPGDLPANPMDRSAVSLIPPDGLPGWSPVASVHDCTAVRLRLASSDEIRSWSFGEVKKPETINPRTWRCEKDGLFCERIFGPEMDWECACGKYRGMRYGGMVCDRCGVKITLSSVRRQRLGHIELAAPVVHIWFWKTRPSRLGLLLDLKAADLERVIYFRDYIVLNPGDTPLKARQLLTEEDFRKARAQYGDAFDANMGAEAVLQLLEQLDLGALSRELRTRLDDETARPRPSQRRLEGLTRRLQVVEAFWKSDNQPAWLAPRCIPVIPPDLRPLVLLDSGNFATSDLNDLYRRIINRNNRLKKLVQLNASEVIIRNEQRMLQQSVDALFDNNRCGRPVLGSSNRPLKSLTDMIKGKQGRFRENLLGKRVDYSARAVVVPDPTLQLHQCGLPRQVAAELFEPFLICRLKELGHADTTKSAKKILERWHPGTRLEPHDGMYFQELRREQEQQGELLESLLEEVTRGHPVLLSRVPTLHRMNLLAFEPVLVSGSALRVHPLVCASMAASFHGGQMVVHLPLSVQAQVEAKTLLLAPNHLFSPANGRPLFSPNREMVDGLAYLTAGAAETDTEPAFADAAEVHQAHAQRRLGTQARLRLRLPPGKLLMRDQDGRLEASPVPPNRRITTTAGRVLFNDLLPAALAFYDVALTPAHLERIVSDCHAQCGHGAAVGLLDRLKELGFRTATHAGLGAPWDGAPEVGTVPYFFAARDSHRGLLARQLHTAEAGYLMRKLIEVAHPVLITLHDCGATRGIRKSVTRVDPRVPQPTLLGRVCLRDWTTAAAEGTVVTLRAQELITAEQAHLLESLRDTAAPPILVRSPLTCQAPHGVCQLCYGLDRATGRLAEEGLAIGILAAQSIGQAGTQALLDADQLGAAADRVVRAVQCAHRLFEARRLPEDLPLDAPLAAALVLLRHLRSLYSGLGADLDDKHFEIILAQMIRLVRVETAGDTDLVPGVWVDRHRFRAAQEHLGPPRRDGPRRATARAQLLGISKVAQRSASFLSAASFERAEHVLLDAALAGQRDELAGLKENVLLGRLIPAGTGFHGPRSELRVDAPNGFSPHLSHRGDT